MSAREREREREKGSLFHISSPSMNSLPHERISIDSPNRRVPEVLPRKLRGVDVLECIEQEEWGLLC